MWFYLKTPNKIRVWRFCPKTLNTELIITALSCLNTSLVLRIIGGFEGLGVKINQKWDDSAKINLLCDLSAHPTMHLGGHMGIKGAAVSSRLVFFLIHPPTF